MGIRLLKYLTMGLLCALITATTVNAVAGEQNLACILSDPSSSTLNVRQVIVGDYSDAQTLQRSSQSARTRKLKKYAVVIELVGGQVGKVVEEKFQVFGPKEFVLEMSPGVPEEATSWNFTLLGSGESYVCSENGTAIANPALTRSN